LSSFRICGLKETLRPLNRVVSSKALPIKVFILITHYPL
jgi:hypothetical protein